MKHVSWGFGLINFKTSKLLPPLFQIVIRTVVTVVNTPFYSYSQLG